MVEIKKLRTNYEVRFNFNKPLSDYIKSLPKDHQQTKMQIVKNEDGSISEDWFRLVSNFGLSEIIFYIKQNNLKFKFTNLEPSEIETLKNDFLKKKKQKEDALNVKFKDLDTTKVDWSFMKLAPYEYQKQAVLFFESAGGNCLLLDSPGVGKTNSLMTYAAKNKLKTLVVCPASLKLNWKNEIHKFTNEKAYVYKWKPKKSSQEIVNTKEESLFHIINYESLETYIKFNHKHNCTFADCGWQEINSKKKYAECPSCLRPKAIKTKSDALEFIKDKDGVELNITDYQLIELDEAHFVKSLTANRTKLIRKAFKDIKYKILATGTGVMNRPIELYSLLSFINPQEWKNVHAYALTYCGALQTKFGWDYSGASNLEELNTRISPISIRRKKEQVLEFLPKKTYSVIPIELTNEEYREYKKIEKNVIEETQEEDTEINHLARIQKLKQYLSKIKQSRTIELAENFIDSGRKVVVMSSFVDSIEGIAKYFGKSAVVFHGKKNMNDKQEAVDRFMKDETVNLFSGGIQSAGVGITLDVSDTLIFNDLDFVPGNMEQGESRIIRASTRHDNVQIIKLVCQDTIDEDIYKLLEEKSKIVSKILDGKEFDVEENKVKGSVFKDLVKVILEKKK